MAIVLNHSPATYSSVNDFLIFTVYESAKYTNTNYKYICDVYVGGVFINRMKAYPDPDNGRGIFDISKVVRDYINTNFSPTPNVIHAQQCGSGEFFIDVVCKFGEDDNGTVTTDLLVDSSRRYYNHYNGRLVGANTRLSDFLDKPLTNRPLTGNTVELTDAFCFLPYFPTDTDQFVVTIAVNGNGAITYGYNPSAANVMQLLNVSPVAINAIFFASFGINAITSSTSFYNITIVNPNISDEPTYRFDLACEPKYTTYKLHFLNQYGGFETFPFRKVSKRSYNVEKKSFSQRPYSMNSSGVVSFYNSNNVYREQKSTYASTFKERLKVTSDWLSDDEFTWLREIAFSTQIYLEQNGYFLPVQIDMSTYEEKTRVVDQLQLLSFDIEYGGMFNAQFR